MLLTLPAADRRPRAQQIVLRIEDMIRKGHLAVGEALPSTRRLAQQLGLHRTTVARSYQTLWALRRCGKLCPAPLVQAALGGRFFLEAAPGTFLRLSIATLDEAEIRAGMARLGLALRAPR